MFDIDSETFGIFDFFSSVKFLLQAAIENDTVIVHIIIHIFSKEDRLFYDLERIWRDGTLIDQSEL